VVDPSHGTIAATFSSSRVFHFFPFFSSLTFSISSLSLCCCYLSSQKQSNTSVYVGVIIAGALVGEKMVNKGFDSMWESRNKGKLFKDLKLPDAEE
jgi:ubiquinol-cytochrome c reductase subunit 9